MPNEFITFAEVKRRMAASLQWIKDHPEEVAKMEPVMASNTLTIKRAKEIERQAREDWEKLKNGL